MAIEEAGANPERMAAAIIGQISEHVGPVPVETIARALDIIDIRSEPLTNLEGALLAPPERGYGAILTNASSSRQRQRFTIGHELMHFLNPWHVPAGQGGFACSKKDMTTGDIVTGRTVDLHLRQEKEANRFAIELLAPVGRIRRYLQIDPELEAVVTIADRVDISREAAARRYVEKHDACIAIAFSRNGKLRYWVRSGEFPRLVHSAADLLPIPTAEPVSSGINSLSPVDPEDWLIGPQNVEVQIQTFYQRDGYAMTLVVVEQPENENDDDGGIEDTYQRFSRF